MNKRSYWFGEGGVYYLTLAPRKVDGLYDSILAQKIGEMDPFVLKSEIGNDVLPERVSWYLKVSGE
jgi:hypothetical protein